MEAVYKQDFRWNDALGSGKYIWGYDGYLQMDGSYGKVQCDRLLEEKITGKESAIQLGLKVTLRRCYHIYLYDSMGRTVAGCQIDRDNHISFFNGKDYIDSGLSLLPAPPLPWWAVQSNDHTYTFAQFDFSAKTFMFKLDDQSFTVPLCCETSDISKLEFQTGIVEPGVIFWLHHFRQTRGPEVVDSEDFSDYWETVPRIAPGYPEDKWYETTYRPKDHRWLEVCTRYGAAYTKLPNPIPHGSVELDMMTTDVEEETQLTLGAYTRSGTPMLGAGAWTIVLGTYMGIWTPFYAYDVEAHTCAAFDDSPPAVAGRIYRLKWEWSMTTQTYELWIDGALQKYKGISDLPVHRPINKGIELIVIHPGRLQPQGEPVLYSYWGNILVETK